MKNKYDVLVAGGGIAGVAAALASARQKKKTVLIEKQCMLGGLATSGLVTIYLPICDGMGHQVSFGIAEELIRLSMKMGYQDKYPGPWMNNGTVEEKKKKRFEVQYNPVYYAILLEQLLLENGVDVLYDTLITDCNYEGNRVTSVTVDNVDGKSIISADSFVDCTGDARLAYFVKDNTRRYEKGNILASWYYSVENNKPKLNMVGFAEVQIKDYTRDKGKTLNNIRYYGDDYDSLNNFIIDSHSSIMNDSFKKLENNPEHEPVMMPGMPQFRMIRCIDGKELMHDENKQRKEDSVGVVADWRRADYVYEVPFGTLCSKNFSNLYFAGRCMASDDAMWDVMRVIPSAAVTGEAAGVAAALCTNKAEDVQKALINQGQILHISDLGI